ncbi:protein translocase subunit SecD [Ahniella affigens]|uniref:Protein translocase subunit SecD n=1 Tax=Ahniella affigens TaxID=2021234 RepID=A0A2P1PLM7_9GAMM|nr:protein translocase subunit SecD [Ahniella affigens]AVP95745.1 protein translocase subunit SecD [Ahniella affigens]
MTFPSWQKYLILVLLLISALFSLPNLYQKDPAVRVSGKEGIAIEAATEEKVKLALERDKYEIKRIDRTDDRIVARLMNEAQQQAAREAIAKELGDNYVVSVDLASTVPGWLTMLKAKPMNLGLDLQGGVHFLAEIDGAEVRKRNVERLISDLRAAMKTKSLAARIAESPQGISLTFKTDAERNAALGDLTPSFTILKFTEVPPTDAGFPIIAEIRPEEEANAMTRAIDQNLVTLRKRLNPDGTKETVIQRQGAARIAIDLPGVQDIEQAKRQIGSTATLEYRQVHPTIRPEEAMSTGRIPAGYRLYTNPDGSAYLLNRRPIATGEQLTSARSQLDAEKGTPAVSVTLNDLGAKKMFAFTQDNVGKPMAVLFVESEAKLVDKPDGKRELTFVRKERVISVANILEPFGKTFQTTGLGSMAVANELANNLNAGSFSAPIAIVEERVIGPSLGAENIKAGVLSVTFSFLFVMVFFVIYYKMFGVVTNLALLLNMLLVVAIMSVLGATLTLPGLAGLALTIGMSVDANVLINERIREELRAGASPLAAIQAGYEKASGTIWDANITAALAGFAMLFFGSGPIQGFAVALLVGIGTSVYTAVSASHGFASMFYNSRRKINALAI